MGAQKGVVRLQHAVKNITMHTSTLPSFTKHSSQHQGSSNGNGEQLHPFGMNYPI
jgi:hypothetical protein